MERRYKFMDCEDEWGLSGSGRDWEMRSGKTGNISSIQGADLITPICINNVLIIILYPISVFPPHAGPSGAYGPEAMGWMDGQAQMMHRPPGDPAFHQGYAHYPPAEYYGHHL